MFAEFSTVIEPILPHLTIGCQHVELNDSLGTPYFEDRIVVDVNNYRRYARVQPIGNPQRVRNLCAESTAANAIIAFRSATDISATQPILHQLWREMAVPSL